MKKRVMIVADPKRVYRVGYGSIYGMVDR